MLALSSSSLRLSSSVTTIVPEGERFLRPRQGPKECAILNRGLDHLPAFHDEDFGPDYVIYREVCAIQ